MGSLSYGLRALLLLGLCLLPCLTELGIGASCGSSGGAVIVTDDTTEPTVSVIKVGTSSLTSNSATVIMGYPILITFILSMDLTTVSNSTLLLQDSDGDTVTGTVAEVTDTDGIANNEFSYSTDDSLLPGAVYTFTIVGEASGVLSASSVPLSADITYSLTMTCPSSDTFDGGATINCWTFRNTTNLTNESDADAAAGEILFGDDDASHFTLTDLTTSFVTSFSSVTQMYKEIEGDFDIQVDLVSASLYNANATAGIWLDDGDFSRTGTNNWAGFRCSLQGNICVVADIADMDPIVGPACIGNSTDSPPTYMDSTLNLSLRVVREGDIFRCYYKESGDADWTNLGGDIEIISKTPDTVTASIHLDNGNSGEIAEVVFDNLIFNSGNAVDQN